MKRTSLFAFALLVSSLVLAGPVTQEEALQRAAQFMASRSQGATTNAIRLAKRQPRMQTTVVTAQTDDAASYYVFNMDTDGGFVIVSGDDRTPSILGYADSGHFDADRIPEGMKAWLKGCEEQMAWLDGGESEESPSPASQSSPVRKAPTLKHSVPPLLTTIWDQGDPYNRMAPVVGSSLSVTGCVATAMAQMMNYHAQQTGMPKTVVNDIPGYNITYNVQGQGEKTVPVASVPKGTVLDWGNMQDSYTENATLDTEEKVTQADAVAKLMLYCGTAVEMSYNHASSNANSYDVPNALKKYFGYGPATRLVQRADYSISQWNDIIYTELTEQRPVFIAGSSSGGGHAFLVDGYDGDELYHVNWGWGGSCNGFYRLTLANPTNKEGTGAGSSDDGYNMNQIAVIGAQPDTGKPFDEGELQLTFQNVSVSGNKVIFNVFNLNETTATFEFGLGYFDEDGTITALIASKPTQLEKYYGYTNSSVTVVPPTEGKVYKMALISREIGKQKWLSHMNTEDYYIEAVKTGSNVKLTLVMPKPQLELAAMTFNRKIAGKGTQHIEAIITNKGGEFYGGITMTATPPGGGNASELTVGATILAGATETVSFAFSPKQQGTYDISFTYDNGKDKNVPLGKDVVNVPSIGYSNTKITIDMQITNSDKQRKVIWGNKAHLVTTVRNDTDNDFEGDIEPRLSSGSYSYNGTQIKYIAAHDVAVFESDIDVVIGQSYVPVCIYQNGSQLVSQYDPYSWYTVVPAITVYDAQGGYQAQEAVATVTIPDDAVAVDITNNSTTKSVTPSSNPNCLYYLSDGADVPNGLTSNVVVGSHADRLTLSDQGLPFKPIAAFTADTVTYTRQFTEGVKAVTDNTGTAVRPSWTTICLPFDVSRCIAGSTDVDWMRHEDDSHYNFWLMEYLGDEHNTLYFAPAEKMQAYTPYMIAVPAAGLKGLKDMTAVPVTFCGGETAITTSTAGTAASTNYKFVGTLENVKETGWVYNLDTDGTGCRKGNVDVTPFRAYLKAMSNSTHTEYVPINMSVALQVEADDSAPMKGDVNGDATVDVADISAVISVMAGDKEREKAADVNGDGIVDVADISAVISIMAGSSSSRESLE